jgi:hypothetical protein
MTLPNRAQQIGLVILLGAVTVYVLWTLTR